MTAVPTELLPEALHSVLRVEGAQRTDAAELFRLVMRELAGLGHSQPNVRDAGSVNAFAAQLEAPGTVAALSEFGVCLWKVEDAYRLVDHRALSGRAAAELMDREPMCTKVVETSAGLAYADPCRFCGLPEARDSGQLLEHDGHQLHARCAPHWDAAKKSAAEWRVASRQGHQQLTAVLIQAMESLARDRHAIGCSFETLLALLLGYLEPKAAAYWRDAEARLRGLVMQDARMSSVMSEAHVALWVVGDDVRLVDLKPPQTAEEAAARLAERSCVKGRRCAWCGIEEPSSATEMLTCRTGVVHKQCEHALFQWQRAASSTRSDSKSEAMIHAQ